MRRQVLANLVQLQTDLDPQMPRLQVIDMSGCVGAITTFIVEPFVPHEEEFYLSIQSQRLGNDISFSRVCCCSTRLQRGRAQSLLPIRLVCMHDMSSVGHSAVIWLLTSSLTF